MTRIDRVTQALRKASQDQLMRLFFLVINEVIVGLAAICLIDAIIAPASTLDTLQDILGCFVLRAALGAMCFYPMRLWHVQSVDRILGIEGETA